MSFEVSTLPRFDKEVKALAKKYRSLKDDLSLLIESLETNPFQGVELTPGIRKIRMPITSKGKGKSGGARIITFNVIVSESEGEVYLVNIYDKSEFTTVDVSVIKSIIKDFGL